MLTKESIITLPNGHLRQTSKKVSAVDDATLELIKNMTEAAIDWEDSRPHEISAALAAVQIDQLSKVVIVRADFEEKSVREFTPLINPEIVKFEGQQITDYEGCLSVKDVYGKVKRWSNIRVKALNDKGEEVRFRAEGFLARVIQHEIDHTKGILFIDHIRDDKQAFYRLDDEGELQPLDYTENIENNVELWED